MKQKITLIAFLLSISSFIGCKKSPEHDNPGQGKVVIDIKTPKPGQEYQAGDTMAIDIQITSDDSLHGYDLFMTSLADTSQRLFITKHIHGKVFNIRETWVNTVLVHSDLELVVSAFMDHNGNTVSKKVRFHCRAN